MKPANLFSALGETSVVSSLLTKQHARKMSEKQQCRCNHLQLANQITIKSALHFALTVGTLRCTFCGMFMRKENNLKLWFFSQNGASYNLWCLSEHLDSPLDSLGDPMGKPNDKTKISTSSKPKALSSPRSSSQQSFRHAQETPHQPTKKYQVPLEDHMASWEILLGFD